MPQASAARALMIAVVVSAALLQASCSRVHAADARIAVATNFADTARQLGGAFEARFPHRLTLIAGATGKLYAQIRRGAPFDVLLAADQQRPMRLVEDGAAVAGSRFTYAIGQLSLWSRDGRASAGVAALRQLDSGHVAMANPDLAPYGAAARQALESLQLLDPLRPRIVYGENVGQAFALVASGNAALGFVATSQLAQPMARGGGRWDVPETLHAPIRQDAVLLQRAVGNPAARAFVEWLASDEARALIAAAGYRLATDAESQP